MLYLVYADQQWRIHLQAVFISVKCVVAGAVQHVWIMTPDMRIVPLGSSSTNFMHWRVPQNSVIWDCFFCNTKRFFLLHRYYCIVTKNYASMEVYACLFHKQHALEESQL